MYLKIIEQKQHICVKFILSAQQDCTILIDKPGDDIQESLPLLLANHSPSTSVHMNTGLTNFGHQLGQYFVPLIEQYPEIDFSKLPVIIYAENSTFFSLLWESLILPKTGDFVALAHQQIKRSWYQDSFPAYNYKLGVQKQTTQEIDLFTPIIVNHALPQSHQPINILHLFDHSSEQHSAVYELIIDSLHYHGAIQHHIYHSELGLLDTDLACTELDYHIIHYHGQIMIEDETVIFSLQEQSLTLDQLAQAMNHLNIKVLFVDCPSYQKKNKPFSMQTGLAELSHFAQQKGISNIIGLHLPLSGYFAAKCWHTLYQQILKYPSLSQSLYQTRTTLYQYQQQLTLSTQSYSPLWAAFAEYSRQELFFFTVAQQQYPIEQSPFLDECLSRIHLLHNQLLPPNQQIIGDRGLYHGLTILSETGGVLLTGKSGQGKTVLSHQLAFYLIYSDEADHIYYFDEPSFFNEKHILEMAAPSFQLANKPEALHQVKTRLLEGNNVFIFDGINHSLSEEVEQFIIELQQADNKIIIIAPATIQFTLPIETIELPLLTPSQLEQLIQQYHLQYHLPLPLLSKTESKQLLNVIDNPQWLHHLVPLLAEYTVPDLINEIKTITDSEQLEIKSFYLWRWRQLDRVWQQLFLLCIQHPYLLLDIVTIAVEQQLTSSKKNNEFKQILSLLGAINLQWEQGIQLWQQSGLLIKDHVGYRINPEVIDLLNPLVEEVLPKIHYQELTWRFNILIVRGINYLSRQMLKQAQPAIVHYLVTNHAIWVRYFEIIWFKAEYSLFLSAHSHFSSLMQKEGSQKELMVWQRQLLRNSPAITLTTHRVELYHFAWLNLAIHSLRYGEKEISEMALIRGAKVFEHWLESYPVDSIDFTTEDEHTHNVYQQVVTFLLWYRYNQQQWFQAITMVEILLVILRQKAQWVPLLEYIHIAITCYHQRHDYERIQQLEHEVLTQIPYDTLTNHLRDEQYIYLIEQRIQRNEIHQAIHLINQLQSQSLASHTQLLITSFTGDIHVQQQEYTQAANLYIRLWHKANQLNNKEGENKLLLTILTSKLHHIATKIPIVEFNQLLLDALTDLKQLIE